ncbi:hypothetical protein CRM22_005102 [Opisthorchis felineus]|uniref:Uncharacterized protein n=1 Tax=Opisthorchis felineus TaxID=147828 RepID=A0A4S2LTZ8_OPIFE|nr:hypothetical protein CRM22_005102 [Opisthorchis felineus]
MGSVAHEVKGLKRDYPPASRQRLLYSEPIHTQKVVCHQTFLLFSLLILGVVSIHSNSNSSQSNVTKSHVSIEEFSSPRLGQIKVGLAFAFFFGVLIACGLPIVLIDYLQKSDSSSPEFSNHNTHADETGCDESVLFVKHSQSPSDDELRNSNDLSPSAWNHEPVFRQPSIDDESVQSPNPANLENTVLLTGHPVAAGSGWSQSRRFQGRISPRLTCAAADTRCTVSARRRSPGLLSRSKAEHKLLLRRWFGRCNCFAAGIFLASGFMELYIDVEETIEEAKTQLSITSEFPFAPFITLIGFFLVLSIEQIVLAVRSAKQHLSHHLHKRPSTPDMSPLDTPLSPQNPGDSTTTPVKFLFNGDATHVSRTTSAPNHLPGETPRRFSSPRYTGPSARYNLSAVSTRPHTHHSHLPDPQTLDSFGSVLRVILLLCAMSVHSLFEGLAVGLQSTVQHTIALFSAILLHKLIIAAGIGVNLATAVPGRPGTQGQCEVSDEEANANSDNGVRLTRRTLCYQTVATLIFSSSSPIGVLIGLGLMQQQQSGVLLMTTATLQGLACGTFFFVVFCELLPQEFREGVGDRIGKLLFLITGFLLVALYSLLMPH